MDLKQIIAAASFQSTRPARGATMTPSPQAAAWSTFQSTRPARGATVRIEEKAAVLVISIHAPREGRDVNR